MQHEQSVKYIMESRTTAAGCMYCGAAAVHTSDVCGVYTTNAKMRRGRYFSENGSNEMCQCDELR